MEAELAKEISEYYAKLLTESTGVPIVAITPQTLSQLENQHRLCDFCNWLGRTVKWGTSCREMLAECIESIRKIGHDYVFFCKSGLIHFASAVMMEDNVVVLMLGGPVVLSGSEPFLAENLRQKFQLDDLSTSEINKRLLSIPSLPADRLYSASATLHAVGEYLNRLFATKPAAADGRYASAATPLTKLEMDVLKFIKSDGIASVVGIIEATLIDCLRRYGENIERIKNLVLQLTLMLSHIAAHHAAVPVNLYGDDFSSLLKLSEISSFGQMKTCVNEIMGRFTHLAFAERTEPAEAIQQTIDYIRQNYMQKITLESAAENIYMSPSYLSKIFKAETGRNFTAYLNEVRIEHAKKLLKKADINLSEVFSMVGYNNQSYFSKIFRMLTGLTPKRYQLLKGNSGSKAQRRTERQVKARA